MQDFKSLKWFKTELWNENKHNYKSSGDRPKCSVKTSYDIIKTQNTKGMISATCMPYRQNTRLGPKEKASINNLFIFKSRKSNPIITLTMFKQPNYKKKKKEFENLKDLG